MNISKVKNGDLYRIRLGKGETETLHVVSEDNKNYLFVEIENSELWNQYETCEREVMNEKELLSLIEVMYEDEGIEIVLEANLIETQFSEEVDLTFKDVQNSHKLFNVISSMKPNTTSQFNYHTQSGSLICQDLVNVDTQKVTIIPIDNDSPEEFSENMTKEEFYNLLLTFIHEENAIITID